MSSQANIQPPPSGSTQPSPSGSAQPSGSTQPMAETIPPSSFCKGSPIGVPDGSSPRDIMRLFFLDDEFVEYILSTTNVRIKNHNDEILTFLGTGKDKHGNDIKCPIKYKKSNIIQLMTSEDWEKFNKIQMIMGIIHQPHLSDYWRTKHDLFGCDQIRSLMGKNRFYTLKSYIYVDVTFWQYFLSKRFQKYWKPGTNIAVDETMIKFKGRYKYRQYVRGKPNSTGLKCYSLADTEGYLLNFFMYQGANKENPFTSYLVSVEEDKLEEERSNNEEETIRRINQEQEIPDDGEINPEEYENDEEDEGLTLSPTIEDTPSQLANSQDITTIDSLSSNTSDQPQIEEQQPIDLPSQSLLATDTPSVTSIQSQSQDGNPQPIPTQLQYIRKLEERYNDIKQETINATERAKIGEKFYVPVLPTKPSDTVIFLTRTGLENPKNHVVYTDQFYGSDKLATYFNNNGWKFVFSCQSNRPTSLFKDLQTDLPKNYIKSVNKDYGTAVSFFDKKKCNFISNQFRIGGNEIEFRSRMETKFTKNLTGAITDTRPQMIQQYNLHKGGVDKVDSHFNRYLHKHKNSKYTLAAMSAFIMIAISNSWIIYKNLSNDRKQRQMSLLQFMLQYLIDGSDDEVLNMIDPYLILNSDDGSTCVACHKRGSCYRCSDCLYALHQKCLGLHKPNCNHSTKKISKQLKRELKKQKI